MKNSVTVLKSTFMMYSRQPGFIILICFAIYFLVSCKKKDTPVPQPPVVITDTASFKITNVVKTEINEFDINYLAQPPAGETYSNLFLIWSTTPDFSTGQDSISITTTTNQPLVKHITNLKQATGYYGRLGLDYKGKRFFSPTKEFITDIFKLTRVGSFDPPRGFSKGELSITLTNFQPVANRVGSDTKIYFGNYQCTLVSDQGRSIQFNVPGSIPGGKYIFKVVSRGMEATWPDSVELLRGKWSQVNSPAIPVNPNASASGLFSFGTCYSPQKGYMVGGKYFNGPSVPFPNSQWPEYIFEFDPQQQSWTRRNLVNPRYFDNPHCYYYNNSIYVIAGHQYTYDLYGTHGMSVKKVQRLDLGNLTWTDVTNVPYPTIFNLASFELNNEWYAGMGADSANISVCCGIPLPSKKFWKYNPASNLWTPLADFPGNHQNFPTCFSVDGKGYAFYGAIPIGDPFVPTGYTRELWEYNPVTNAWTSIQLPLVGGQPAGEKYRISVYNGKAYFISGQERTLFYNGYGYTAKAPCLEWDPAANTLKQVAFPYDAYILKEFFKQDNTFYYQTDATGYFESIPNKTFSFAIEQ